MVSSSPSSPAKMKRSNFSKLQETLFKKPSSSSKANSLAKRQNTLFKKASELSTLCGIDVCVIYYGSDGELKTWPEDRDKVKDMARRYMDLPETKRRRGRVDLVEFLEKINKDDSKKKMQKKEVKFGSGLEYPVWDPKYDNYSEENLSELIQSLEHNRTRLQHRFDTVVETQKQRNMSDQKQRTMMTNPNLQQHSNQVSLFLFNHGNGTISQIPFSSSAFNQTQSLAPIPNHLTIYPNSNQLTIYPNSNVGNYSGMFGLQDSVINESLDQNMLTYNNSVEDFSRQIYPNSNVGNYSGMFGLQDYVINESLDHNMLTYNNSVDDFSRQIYPNSNVGSYSGMLGLQETVVNESLDQNMLTYNNSVDDFSRQIYQNYEENNHLGLLGVNEIFQNTNMYSSNNMNMESYSELLGVEGTGINGLQNMNMYGYNDNSNPNGLSHQFGQFPTQTTASGFQFGSVQTQY